MEELFYSEECLVELLEQKPGETIIFIGIDDEDNGTLTLYKHVNVNSMKYIETYVFANNSVILVSKTPINLQLSHDLFLDRYKCIIQN